MASNSHLIRITKDSFCFQDLGNPQGFRSCARNQDEDQIYTFPIINHNVISPYINLTVFSVPLLCLFYREPNEQMARNPNASSAPLSNTPLSPAKNSFSGQTGVSSLKPGPLPSNLDDLKV